MDQSASATASVFLSDLTWVEARHMLTPETVVLLPVGAIEAHGPHLPLDTDVVIAREIARRTAIRMRHRREIAIVAPPICYGVSYVGSSFPGTVPLPARTVAETISSVITGLASAGPRRIVVVNAHLEPAHVEAVTEGVAQAAIATGASIAFPEKREPRWAAHLSEEFRRGARHAGSYETSLMLAADPNRVRRDLLPNLPPVEIDLPARLRAGARTFDEAGGVDAYFGDPARATAEEGERLFEALVSMIETALAEITNDRI